MAWEGSDRKARLPAHWNHLRAAVLRRDGYLCQVPGCEERANQVDHIQAGDDDDMSNLQALCGPHHQRKSSSEGRAAQLARLRELRAMTKRKPEDNPGRIRPQDAEPRNRGW